MFRFRQTRPEEGEVFLFELATAARQGELGVDSANSGRNDRLLDNPFVPTTCDRRNPHTMDRLRVETDEHAEPSDTLEFVRPHGFGDKVKTLATPRWPFTYIIATTTLEYLWDYFTFVSWYGPGECC